MAGRVNIGTLREQPSKHMMSKEEYLAKAAARYEALQKLNEQKDFYSHEAEFDRVWTDLGREVLEGTIGKVPTNKRKKTSSAPASDPSK